MKTQTITIPRQEYEELKMKAEIDMELLADLITGLTDIKMGRVTRVK